MPIKYIKLKQINRSINWAEKLQGRMYFYIFSTWMYSLNNGKLCSVICWIAYKHRLCNNLNAFFAGTTGCILLLAFVVDIVVWYKAGSISFVEEQEAETGTAEEMATLKSQDAQAVENDYLWRFRITLLRWRAATATLSSSSSKDAIQCRRIRRGIVLHEWCQYSSSCFPETAKDRLAGDYTHQNGTFLERVPFWWTGSRVPLVDGIRA